MEQIIAIVLIAVLVITYIALHVLNHRTPIPEGCEDVMASAAKCSGCNNSGCGMKTRVMAKGGKK